jgi:hypothetical protein
VLKSGGLVSSKTDIPLEPASAPELTVVRPVSRPTQSEAHDEINDWLESELQLYVDEGQRMCDAANGISVPKRPVPLGDTNDTAVSHENAEHPVPPQTRPEHDSTEENPPGETLPQRNADTGDVPPSPRDPVQLLGIARYITISGESHHIHLNTGTGVQNVAHYWRGIPGVANGDQGHADERHGSDVNENNGHHDDDENRDDYGRNPEVAQQEESRNGREDHRYDDRHDARDGSHRRRGSSYERLVDSRYDYGRSGRDYLRSYSRRNNDDDGQRARHTNRWDDDS